MNLPMTRQQAAREAHDRLQAILRATTDWERIRGNPHQLPSLVRREVKAGRVRQITPVMSTNVPGVAEVYVRRLKPRPPAWRKPALVAAAGTVVIVTGLGVLYVVARILLAFAVPILVVLCVVVVLRHLAEHRPTCPGMISHCPGCRG